MLSNSVARLHFPESMIKSKDELLTVELNKLFQEYKACGLFRDKWITVGQYVQKYKNHFLCPIDFSCALTHILTTFQSTWCLWRENDPQTFLYNRVLGNACTLIRKWLFYCSELGFILAHVSVFYWAWNVLLHSHNPKFCYFAKVNYYSILLKCFLVLPDNKQ